MRAHLYIEGAESKEDQVRCREAFRNLIRKLGFAAGKRMPRLSACGGRNSVFDHFKTAHAQRQQGDYIAMLVDSEDPVGDVEKTWAHLKTRDNWDKPAGADDEQVLFNDHLHGVMDRGRPRDAQKALRPQAARDGPATDK